MDTQSNRFQIKLETDKTFINLKNSGEWCETCMGKCIPKINQCTTKKCDYCDEEEVCVYDSRNRIMRHDVYLGPCIGFSVVIMHELFHVIARSNQCTYYLKIILWLCFEKKPFSAVITPKRLYVICIKRKNRYTRYINC